MMKRKIASILCTAVLTASMLAGCGSAAATSTSSAAASASSAPAASVSAASTSAAESTSAENAVSETSSESVSVSSTSYAPIDLADGTYTATFDTDSTMFRVNEANDNKGTLTVKDGKATIHVSLMGTGIVNLFVGTKEEAQKDGAKLLEPTNDTVTYDDGTSEDVYGFDIPVPVIGKEFDVAIIGTKGKWYDHKVTVSDPVPADKSSDVQSAS